MYSIMQDADGMWSTVLFTHHHNRGRQPSAPNYMYTQGLGPASWGLQLS